MMPLVTVPTPATPRPSGRAPRTIVLTPNTNATAHPRPSGRAPRTALLTLTLLLATNTNADIVPGLERPVEIIRDKWGVPHIYAQTTHDVFFAQGWIAAKDRLWQIDLWRRQGSGHLAEVLGPSAVARDRLARLVRYRGKWDEEWKSYAPDAQATVTAFTQGINAYIASLKGQRPPEFAAAGYDPGRWEPRDVASRIAGLVMCRNLARELQRAIDIRAFGLDTVSRLFPPDPAIKIEIPRGLDLADLSPDILRDYSEATNQPRIDLLALDRAGSNNWVIDGTMSATGQPLLANDPHRPIQLPSLRKTVHLIAPGLNVIGAGEPALPGVALGHNEQAGFGFTIVGTDQQDLYVEELNPANPLEYKYRGAWRKMEVERDTIAVKGQAARAVEYRYTIHGPVIFEDRRRAYALKWVGAEPGGAGYLPALSLMRARNWTEFKAGVARYKVPSENLVYADRLGNIGWLAAGWSPIRKNWSGLLPVPGAAGEYEWQGYLPLADHPQKYNPPQHFVATANHNILPENYPRQIAYEWAQPFRFERLTEMLTGRKKITVAQMAEMQSDIVSLPARRLQGVLKRVTLNGDQARIFKQMKEWDAAMRANSSEALIFEVWMGHLGPALFGDPLGTRVEWQQTLRTLEADPAKHTGLLADTLAATVLELTKAFGPEQANWHWGRVHQVQFRHPLGKATWNRGPFARPGDAHTVNATSGTSFRQTAGASFRMVLDPSNWDNSVMTNTPGESGDPASKHYDDLIQPWSAGQHHPLPYTRRAVEAAAAERIRLTPR